MKSVCVFCGSRSGANPAFVEAARETGVEIARRGMTLIYGGGHVGLMGTVADAALDAGGEVVGIIPQALVDLELAHAGLTELHVVRSMHERKAMMEQLSEGFVALPGGFGTLEEFCEIVTWAQLGIHGKPCALLNVEGYYDTLIRFLDETVVAAFVNPAHRGMILVDTVASPLLDALAAYEPPDVVKWVTVRES